MKIAVGTDDLENIRSGHFGESRFYKIFTIENGQILRTEVRENPYVLNAEKEHEHGQAKNIMQLLKDCDVFLARSMGLHSIPRLIEKGKKPLITKISRIDAAIGQILSGDWSQFKCFDVQKAKFVTCQGGI